LKIEDAFVSGPNEGRVRQMLNDTGVAVKEAYPGQAVYLSGFRTDMPEVGQPLYVVKSADEARTIVSRLRAREEQKKMELKANSGEGFLVNDMKKKMGKLTRFEKRAIKGGDKSILYEKLGML